VTAPRATRWFIVGGAGFIGGHFVDRLLDDSRTVAVTVFDNFSSGRAWHVAAHDGDDRINLERGGGKEDGERAGALVRPDTEIPDIARASTEPAIDFVEGTYLTHRVVEAMRVTGASRILYASGSGVYGDLGLVEADEDHGPLVPTSTYGASKLAGEALIAAYVAMFGLTGCVFRFGNVVGPRQTHGVGFDFVRRLLDDPTRLTILGDGTQSKSYIHVEDVLRAVLLAHDVVTEPFAAFNVATGDYITVREIADLACEVIGLGPAQVQYDFTGGSRGWKGDVPVVRLATARIRSLGWTCERTSSEALRAAMQALAVDARAGRL
jgi:UDP-glucose 4-epimerase